MKILLIGGTGKVGSHLVQELLAKGAQLRILSRDAGRAGAVPAGVETVVADILQDTDTCIDAFKDVDAMFMLNPLSSTEATEGLIAVQIGKSAGIGRIVYQSVGNIDEMAHVPHVASKIAIERAIVESGMAWTFIRPSYFMQNDLTSKPGLEKGLYTQPLGKIGASSVDIRDIAEAEAIALLEDGHEGQIYNLVGPDVLTGESGAAIWSQALGKEIRYVGSVDGWRAATKTFLPPWLNYDLGLMYRSIEEKGMLAGPDDVSRVTQLLKRSPRSYQDYVIEQAGAWGMKA
ncbi:NmrA/HSCARG family protein [soil metagenome]